MQKDSVSMGSSLGPIAACLYMDYFEESTFQLARQLNISIPSMWFRYIDDVLAFWKFSEEEFDVFLRFLNSRESSINFTCEKEKDGILPFLDLLIDRSGEDLQFSIYRKSTHTDSYLNRTHSCHPKNAFKSTVRSLHVRADRLCSRPSLAEERQHLRRVFMENGYSEQDICFWSGVNTAIQREYEPPKATIPYYPGIGEKIRSVLSDSNISIALRPSSTLQSMLVRKRPSPAIQLGSVYHIPCSEDSCSFSYVGETSRPLKERKKEHLRAVKDMDVYRSEIAKHVTETGHMMSFDDMRRVDGAKQWRQRITKEAIWTKKLGSGNKTKVDLGSSYNAVL